MAGLAAFILVWTFMIAIVLLVMHSRVNDLSKRVTSLEESELDARLQKAEHREEELRKGTFIYPI